MQEHDIGDLVVAGLDEPVSKTSAAIGLVVDKSPHGDLWNGHGKDVLYVLWPDGTICVRWGHQVLSLEE